MIRRPAARRARGRLMPEKAVGNIAQLPAAGGERPAGRQRGGRRAGAGRHTTARSRPRRRVLEKCAMMARRTAAVAISGRVC